MLASGNSRWLAIAVTLACLVLVVSTVAVAQGDDLLHVTYFSNNGGTLDQEVRVINPGAYAPSYPPSNLCAMIYVFNNDQELQECCGCLISPDGLLELSVNRNLTSNTFTGIKPANGDIKVVSALPNDFFGGVPCDPTGGGILPNGGYALNIFATPDIRGWSTHVQTDGRITEDELQPATLSEGEIDSLQEECYGIASVGSGFGICAEGVANSSEICN
ncbi:MAG TPA: hypothetical protein VFF64_18600 [Candidatus Eremiobacteraceae bacterium]|nr:hypothetical protein [Candidatus Eremiobacteraceae bacterium]